MAYRAKDYNEIDWNEIFIADCSSPSGLIWKKNFGQRARCGNTAGSINTAKPSGRQCFQVKYNKTSWLVHRILWIIWNGSVNPDLDIDHIDGNSLNNSVENLRLVSTAVNSRNQKQRIDNSSGFTGVSFMINQDGNTYGMI
jgi:HNH endonuclease